MKSKITELLDEYILTHTIIASMVKPKSFMILIHQKDSRKCKHAEYKMDELDIFIRDRDTLDLIFEHGWDYYQEAIK